MFLSHINVSLSLSLCLKSIKIFLRIKKKEEEFY